MSMNRQVNFLRRFNYPDSVIGRQLFGRLLDEAYVEFTLSEDANPQTRESLQYSIFAKMRAVDAARVIHGSRARVGLSMYKPVAPPGIWIAQRVERTT